MLQTRVTRLPLWLALAALGFAALHSRRAEALVDYPGCTALGAPLVDHACFHAQFGPFETIAANPNQSFPEAAPNVNNVHTQYTVSLPGPSGANEGTVKYRPARTGDWAHGHSARRAHRLPSRRASAQRPRRSRR